MRRFKLGIWSNRGNTRERKSSKRSKGVKRSPDLSDRELARLQKGRRKRQSNGFKKMPLVTQKRILWERREREIPAHLLFVRLCFGKKST